ncbi:hypothetical protein EDC52_102633 [Biostraticola tofi]|uniref:Uncharacterized protein n=1 Tax=Biostraticola tofi TaxID=466109 RepID=A0A4R3Z2W8_9GAMM|nr:hypothetical protein EDC52_102633 [Biostraticola tofi]
MIPCGFSAVSAELKMASMVKTSQLGNSARCLMRGQIRFKPVSDLLDSFAAKFIAIECSSSRVSMGETGRVGLPALVTISVLRVGRGTYRPGRIIC